MFCKRSFPIDVHDRYWESSPAPNVPFQILPIAPDVIINPEFCRDVAPQELLQTAVAWQKDVVFSLPFNVSGGDRNYVVLLWFAETDAQAQTKTREFEVGINENWQEPINIRNVTGALNTGYEWGYGSVVLTDTSTISFRATSRSELGPILNGLEVYTVSDPVRPRTDLQDGKVLSLIIP